MIWILSDTYVHLLLELDTGNCLEDTFLDWKMNGTWYFAQKRDEVNDQNLVDDIKVLIKRSSWPMSRNPQPWQGYAGTDG